MSITRYEVDIDLSQVEQARLSGSKKYFHQEIYQSLTTQVSTQIMKSERIQIDRLHLDISDTRSHDAILLNGMRGCGKTSILVNFPTYMKEANVDNRDCAKILFLDPVDPTLLNEKEDFLNIVLGQINACEEVRRARDKVRAEYDAYERTLEQVAEAMEGEQTLKERFGLDRLLSYQGGLEIATHAHAYFREVLRLTGKSLIVLPIDDVDMSLTHGFKVLEVVRKYLCSPHFLPIVSGDLTLYRELVVNHFSDELVKQSREETAKKKLREQAADLANEYLRKVFPIHNRHTVPTIEGYLHGRAPDGTPMTATVLSDAKHPLIELASLGHLVRAALNGRANGEEQSTIDVNLPTARQLIQFLKSLEESLSQMLANAQQQNRPVPLPFQSQPAAVDWWLRQDQKTAASFYTALSKYFSNAGEQKLQYLCEDLAGLNLPANQHGIELRKLTYLSLVRQARLNLPSDDDKRQNETYALYVPAEGGGWAKEQLARVPVALREEAIRTLTPLPAIEPADHHLIFTKGWKASGRDEQFLHDLLTHSDFYTSYQTTSLVFFGRFFELVTTSLMRDIDGKWLDNLLTRPPYYSIFDTSGTKTFDLDDDDAPLGADDDAEPAAASLLSRGDLDMIALSINQFRKDAKLGESAFVDLAVVHSLQSKYFNQLNLFKKAGHVGMGKKGIRKAVPQFQLLSELASRAMYSYWTALGSFELRELYFSPVPRIVHQNFASTAHIKLGSLKSNAAYTHNVKPFEDLADDAAWARPPMTKLLAEHPIFKMVRQYEGATAAAPQALVTIASGATADPAVVQPSAPAAVDAARRPKYYNALSRFVRSFFSVETFNRCVAASKQGNLEFIAEAVKSPLSQLGAFAESACQGDKTQAKVLLRRLGSSIRTRQFFNQRNGLDQLLLVVVLTADSQKIQLSNRAAMTSLLENLGMRKPFAEMVGRGI